MSYRRSLTIATSLVLLVVVLAQVAPTPLAAATSGAVDNDRYAFAAAEEPTHFTFAVTADQRWNAGSGYDNSSYYRGVMEAIHALGGGAFMVSPGDIDPPEDSMWTIEQVMGTDYLWYPVVGNHELDGILDMDMDWLRSYDYDQNGTGVAPDLVNTGPSGCPETTYSFDYDNAHFVVLNEYCNDDGDNVAYGDVPDHLYNWLVADLQGTTKEHIFVFGHEPAFPQPDADTGDARHVGDSLDQYPANRDRFWDLLKAEGVVAYICGHTHKYSAVKIDGVWQIDAGHARGKGDTSAPSTFLMIHVDGDMVTMDAYREAFDGVYDYDDIVRSKTLAAGGLDYIYFIPGLKADF